MPGPLGTSTEVVRDPEVVEVVVVLTVGPIEPAEDIVPDVMEVDAEVLIPNVVAEPGTPIPAISAYQVAISPIRTEEMIDRLVV